MELEEFITSGAIVTAITALVFMTYKHGGKIGKLEGKMDTTCDNVSKLIDRIDKSIDKK